MTDKITGELVWIDHDRLTKLGQKKLFKVRQAINSLVHDKVLINPDVAGQVTMAEGVCTYGGIPENGTFVLVALNRDKPKPELKVVE